MSMAMKSAVVSVALSLAVPPALALTGGEVTDMPPHIRRAWVFGAANMAAHMFERIGDKTRAECIRRWRGDKWNYSLPQARLLERIALDEIASRLALAEIDRELAENERKRQEMLDGAARVDGGTSARSRPGSTAPDSTPPARPADRKADKDDSHAVFIAFKNRRGDQAAALADAVLIRECGAY